MSGLPADRATCCVVGGGPAGIFLGYLLARSGIQVIVLEKHADFLRDFRGDTIHPSTLQLLDELSLLDEVLSLTDFRAERLKVCFEGRQIPGPDFSHLATKCGFIGFVPQWDFLELVSRHGKELPGFDLRMNTRATGIVRDSGRVVGVRCETDERNYTVHADLVVAADGRSSTIREATDHSLIRHGIPIDALWFRLDPPASDTGETIGWLKDGHMLVTIPRHTHYQVAMVIRKGAFDEIKARGIDAFRETIGTVCPPLRNAAGRLNSWDDVKLLSVQINRLQKWFENGLLFIGDAAHAMSPVGGVGINLAIQDAVATANRLVKPLQAGSVSERDLRAVQRRREPAARKTQWLQATVHSLLFGHAQAPGRPFSMPWLVRMMVRLVGPVMRKRAGRWIGLGFQPEHITSTAAPAHRRGDRARRISA